MDKHAVHDGMGNPAGCRPGFLFSGDAAARGQVRAAYDEMVTRATSAWHPPARDAAAASDPAALMRNIGEPSEGERMARHLLGPEEAASRRAASYEAYKASLASAWQYQPSNRPWRPPGPLVALAEAVASITSQPPPYTASSAPPYVDPRSAPGNYTGLLMRGGDAAQPDQSWRPEEMRKRRQLSASEAERMKTATWKERDTQLANAWRAGGSAPSRADEIERQREQWTAER